MREEVKSPEVGKLVRVIPAVRIRSYEVGGMIHTALSNRSDNEYTDYLAKKYGLNKEEASELHWEVSKKGYDR